MNVFVCMCEEEDGLGLWQKRNETKQNKITHY